MNRIASLAAAAMAVVATFSFASSTLSAASTPVVASVNVAQVHRV